MHSFIYQIGTKPFNEEEPLTSDNVFEGTDVFLNYTYNLTLEEKLEAIESLVESVLPKGMFTLTAGNNLIYNGGFKIWRKSYYDGIMSAVKTLTPANVMEEYGNILVLKGAVSNPLNTVSLFVCGSGVVARSIKLMKMVESLNKGDVLYIGSVLGYHN